MCVFSGCGKVYGQTRASIYVAGVKLNFYSTSVTEINRNLPIEFLLLAKSYFLVLNLDPIFVTS